ncbi:MAG TPA: hypothetical protein VMZ53_01010 [Kofleriaceae bacterium]|nr:hypothetical protein [Kofleriaceae bacterium]
MMTRRELIASLASGAALVACGGNSVTPDATASCTDRGTIPEIAQNHGHVLAITVEDIEAGVEKTYDIMGTSLHTHSVTITAEQFAMLRANQTITVTSTLVTAHSHSVVVKCA